MVSTQYLVYINIGLAVAILGFAVRLILRARKSGAGKDRRMVGLITLGRLLPAAGCIASGLVYVYDGVGYGIATLILISLVGAGLTYLGYRIGNSGSNSV